MATAEGIAKLVQKQAGRAKEKVSTTHHHPKIAPLLSRPRICHLIWHSGSVVVPTQWGALTLDRIDMGRGQRWVVVAPFVRSLPTRWDGGREGVVRLYARLTWPHPPHMAPLPHPTLSMYHL